MVMKDPPRVDEVLAKFKVAITSLQQLAAQKTGEAAVTVSNYYTGSKRLLDKFLGTPVDIKAKFSAQHGMFAQDKANKAMQDAAQVTKSEQGSKEEASDSNNLNRPQ